MGNCCNTCISCYEERHQNRLNGNEENEETENTPLLGHQRKYCNVIAIPGRNSNPKPDAPVANTENNQNSPLVHRLYTKNETYKLLHLRQIHLPQIAEDIRIIVDQYNKVLTHINWLQDNRDPLLYSCLLLSMKPSLEKIGTCHLGSISVKLWRDETGTLKTSDRDKKPNLIAFWIRKVVGVINYLEDAEDLDQSPIFTRVLETTRDKDSKPIEAENYALDTVDTVQCKTNNYNVNKLIKEFPELWTKMMEKKNDLIKEYLEVFEPLMIEIPDVEYSEMMANVQNGEVSQSIIITSPVVQRKDTPTNIQCIEASQSVVLDSQDIACSEMATKENCSLTPRSKSLLAQRG